MEYDVHFTLISNHIGNSASFEVYVNILTLLSKADGEAIATSTTNLTLEKQEG